MAKAKAFAGKVTMRDLFRFLLRTEKDYPCDLKSNRLVKVVGDSFHLNISQVRGVLRRLEREGFIEVARDGVEILRVSIMKRGWTEVPKEEV